MCNFKLIGVRYFNKALKQERLGLKIVDLARNTIGHETEIASIAAGNYVKEVSFSGYAKGTVKGVAPFAKLAIYKVSWAEGLSFSDVLFAMNQAISDGVDILSISSSDESDAQLVIEYTKKNSKPNATIKFQQTIMGVKHTPAVPSYSTRGPSQQFPNILKPDVIAPGSLVL
ncbi:hypothetical protein ACE6H2_000632 [Prunus campanulata]